MWKGGGLQVQQIDTGDKVAAGHGQEDKVGLIKKIQITNLISFLTTFNGGMVVGHGGLRAWVYDCMDACVYGVGFIQEIKSHAHV